jgi:hypothetical protein
MAPTVGQIEVHIDRAREELGANLKELEHRVEAATDWRSHFRDRPLIFIGTGFVIGAVIGAMGPNSRRPAPQNHGDNAGSGAGNMSAFVREALLTFAAAWLRVYFSGLVSRPSRTD